MQINQVKGFNYEVQIRDYIRNTLKKNAYLWNDTPENILIKSGIIGSHNQHRLMRKERKENPIQDTGVDVIQLEENDLCSLVQCKNGYKSGLTMNNLAGFMCWIATLDKLNGYVYYTDKLSTNIKELPFNKRIQFIKQKYNNIVEEQNTHSINPYDYQITAKEEFKEYFKTKDRGILSMPCGTGKTFTSFLISQNYKQIIIISPLKQFAKQNLDRYIEYGYNENNTLLVDSDGERDIKQIEKFIKENKSFLISSTYCSADVIYKSLKYMNVKDVLIIVDEFHNICKTNMIDENDNFNKILYSPYRILFMSATPRIYEMEYDDNDNEETNDELFGEIVYNMTFTEAIEKKYITDYRIWLPSIHEDVKQLNNELSVYEIDSVIKAKCNFLFSCLLNNGSKKCIIYCVDNKELDKMKEAMNLLNEFYCLEYDITQITSIDSEKKRESILDNFRDGIKIQLLFSIRILDECIDIPSCDSIYITYPTENKIRIIQRMCRCIRTDKKNSYKIGNVYIWCDQYDKILDTLSGIKEYDIFFKDKIHINENDFYGEKKEEGVNIDIQLIEKYVLGIKEFRCLSWEEKLEWVKKYIDDNGKKPTACDKNNDIKSFSCWLSIQQGNYKYNKNIMTDNNIKKIWENFISDDKYSKYFLTNEYEWILKLNEIKKYMDENNNRPSSKDKNIVIKKNGAWLRTQIINYKNNKYIMKNNNIKNIWEKFINDLKYKKYFDSNEEIWIENLNYVKKYIDENKKRPSRYDKNKKIKKYSHWITIQIINYKQHKQIMKDNRIRKLWEELINDLKYKKYFLSNENEWIENLEWVKKYINENKKKPSKFAKNSEIKNYNNWINTQNLNYKNNEQIMKNNNIKKLWYEFINDLKYKKYFFSNEEAWIENLNYIKKYIEENEKKPSSTDKNIEIKKYGSWIEHQLSNYKWNEKIMKINNIKNLWEEFINDMKYKKYFKNNEV
jgi:superfamily II DNA or RNA helicase